MSERQSAFQGEYRSANHLTSYIWTDVVAGSLAHAPDTDTALSVANCRTITVQLDSTSASNLCANVDLNVIGSLDGGVTYDEVAWSSLTGIGTGTIISFAVPPGHDYLKLTLDNNGAATATIHADVFLRG